MAVLSRIAKTIDESTMDWRTMATKIGFSPSLIEQIKDNNEPTKEFVSRLTSKIWDNIFKYFKVDSDGTISDDSDGTISRLANILLEERDSTSRAEEHTEAKGDNSQDIDIMHEISKLVADWKAFARVLGFAESLVQNLESTVQVSLTGDIFEANAGRNKYIMNEALKILNVKNIETNSTSWTFWRNYLQKFHNGKEVIKEMERFFPVLLAENSFDQVHEFSSAEMTYIGHPLQHEPFQINKNNTEIPVNVGSGSFQIIDIQEHPEWLETQQRYMEVFDVFNDKVVFNFHDLEEYCPILNTLEQFINETGGNAFATKSYQLVDHVKMFDNRVFVDNGNYDNYFCFLGNNNIAINFTKCGKEPGHALHYSSQNIQIMNALHKELQSKDIIQVNVLVHDGHVSLDFCKGCLENCLYIKEEVLTDIKKFNDWFSKVNHLIHSLRKKMNISTSLNGNLLNNIKKDMITYEALQNADAFPTFSNLPEDQINEIPKILFLTGVQFTLLHTKKDHIVVRGPYGSGKSIVLQKKIDQCINSLNKEDILYYICHDQQSKFSDYMKIVKEKYGRKNVVICNSRRLQFSRHKPTLSLLLNHILHFWKGKTVHIFVDEFPGVYINKKEIDKLKKILPNFSNSQIMIALQSMEEYVYQDMTDELDIGYQYDYLEKNTSFVVYKLDYSLRCSAEINEFVKFTAHFIEEKEVSLRKFENFYDYGKYLFVDKEYGQERNIHDNDKSGIKTKLSYNFSEKFCHFSQNDSVCLYVYDKFNAINQKRAFSLFKSRNIDLPVEQFHVAALEYILNNASSDEKFVVCTYDELLYNSTYYYLEKRQGCIWTSEIKAFVEINSKFNILLADYASVRGYEFSNFIFLLHMGTRYLKYRMIECFTRATTKLHIIVDNNNTYDKSSADNQLIGMWRHLPCVEYFDCKYDPSKDKLQILRGGSVTYLKNHLRDIHVGYLKKFPWNLPQKTAVENKQDNLNDLYRTICYLCDNDNVEVICQFFKVNQIDVLNYRGGYGQNLLHITSINGGINIADYLISECHVDVDSRDGIQRTPLLDAAEYGQVRVAKYLIDNKANIHAKGSDGETPLHDAAENGCVDLARLLIDNNANINAADKKGRTPLHYAASKGYIHVARLLIESGANVHIVDINGQAPLDEAENNFKHDVACFIKLSCG